MDYLLRGRAHPLLHAFRAIDDYLYQQVYLCPEVVQQSVLWEKGGYWYPFQRIGSATTPRSLATALKHVRRQGLGRIRTQPSPIHYCRFSYTDTQLVRTRVKCLSEERAWNEAIGSNNVIVRINPLADLRRYFVDCFVVGTVDESTERKLINLIFSKLEPRRPQLHRYR